MHQRAHGSTGFARRLALIALSLSLAACAHRTGHDRRVTLIAPFDIVAASTLPQFTQMKIGRLSTLDGSKLRREGTDDQTLSLFGREDLIAGTNDNYKPSDCMPSGETDVLGEIERQARATSIVIINESHVRSEHRDFTAQVAERLSGQGYDVLALETLGNPVLANQTANPPSFLFLPAPRPLNDNDGFYTSEAAFGRLGARAAAAGYRLLAYESPSDNLGPDATREQQIAFREEAQASNLAAFLRANPGRKLLVHVGYSHAREVATPSGDRWMALRLKQKTGIDPLTISQTTCRGGGKAARLSRLPTEEPEGSFDLVVDHPAARFNHGRPVWRTTAGDQAIAIPAGLRPKRGWRIIEARAVGAPAEAISADRVAVRPDENIDLLLPPGRYKLRGINVPDSPAGQE